MSTSTFLKTTTPFVFRNTVVLTTGDTLITHRSGMQMRIRRIIVQGPEIPVSSDDSIRLQADDGTNQFDICTPIFNTSGVAERSERRRVINTNIVIPERGAAAPNDLNIVLSSAFGAEFGLVIMGEWEDSIPNHLENEFAAAALPIVTTRQVLQLGVTGQSLLITQLGFDGIASAADGDLHIEHGDGTTFETVVRIQSSLTGEATPLASQFYCKIEIPSGNNVYYTVDAAFQNTSSVYVSGVRVNDVRTIDPAGTP